MIEVITKSGYKRRYRGQIDMKFDHQYFYIRATGDQTEYSDDFLALLSVMTFDLYFRDEIRSIGHHEDRLGNQANKVSE